MKNKFELKGNFYNGRYHSLQGDKKIVKMNPSAFNEILWEMPVDHSHGIKIMESAVSGYQLWRKVPLEKRIEALLRYKAALIKREDEMTEALALETGKPLWEARQEAKGLAAKVDVTISDSLPRVADKTIDQIMPGTKGSTLHRPIGPSLVIGPFNFPCHLANGQIVNALIAGNSIIFKPSEKTAFSPQLMMDALVEAEFPVGVVNLLQGDGAAVAQILSDKRIKGVFFTGSREVGKKILQATHLDLGKMVALELGGKNTTIVDKDVPLEYVVSELLSACFLTAGQRCTSTSLVVVHQKIYGDLLDLLRTWTKKIIIGAPHQNPTPFMGPLIDENAVQLYQNYIDLAKEQGAKEWLPMQNLCKEKLGYFSSPSILTYEGTWQNKSFIGKEIFAPNTLVIPFHKEEEAIAIANSTEYGLAAAVFSQDSHFIQHCLMDIDAGVINVNKSTVGASGRLPFGGLKESGNYRPAAVSMIDSCVHAISSLQMNLKSGVNWDAITGLTK
ncbi:MAG: aldehyde dehydrogenase family protein [Bacteriovoracaceae bacterium]|nr:aldehyde dehydrogenase family protein [Bacteriovoracaceae bacterium]